MFNIKTATAVAAMIGCAGASLAQSCSSWQTLMTCFQNNPNLQVEGTLGSGDYFGLYADPVSQFVLMQVGQQVYPITGWMEDASGSVSIEGVSFACQPDGRIQIEVEDSAGLGNRFDISQDGHVLVAGVAAYRKFDSILHPSSSDGLCRVLLDSLPTQAFDSAYASDACHGVLSFNTSYVSDMFLDDEGRECYDWYGSVSSSSGTAYAMGFIVLHWGDYVFVPYAMFDDQVFGANFNSRMALANCTNCVISECAAWDYTAQFELIDLLNDSQACKLTKDQVYWTALIGCGTTAIISCWFPPAALVCGGSLGCAATAGLGSVWFNLANVNEIDRVRACICNHAIARTYPGVNPAPCIYQCPPYLPLP